MSVTLQINLSAGDIRYAHLTLPRLIEAHRDSVEEVLLVVDCCKPQKTRIVDPATRFPEPLFAQKVQTISALAEELRSKGLCDRVVLLQAQSDFIPDLKRKYLRPWVKGTHDYGGCGLLSYLAGIELSKTRFVLHYDADMLLYQKPGYVWTQAALGLMAQSPTIVAATPRISPPFTTSITVPDAPSLHEGRPFIKTEGGWINDWFSTRCFLLDKQKLLHYLPLLKGRLLLETIAVKILNRGYPRSPEIMFFRRIGRSGGHCLNLNSTDAWLLHPREKQDGFIQLLPAVINAVSRGEVPEPQRGFSDIALEAWQKFLPISVVAD